MIQDGQNHDFTSLINGPQQHTKYLKLPIFEVANNKVNKAKGCLYKVSKIMVPLSINISTIGEPYSTRMQLLKKGRLKKSNDSPCKMVFTKERKGEKTCTFLDVIAIYTTKALLLSSHYRNKTFE